jgi:polyphosphate:nucleotide phosphotransferase, PPK2 family
MNRLSNLSTRAPENADKEKTKEKTKELLKELDELQYLLYAEAKHAVLVIMQGMDASGKDGAIKQVFGKLNPQGVAVRPFKQPTAEELVHDFLWRIHRFAPEKGMIQVFNRSHYEDVLVTRVHGLCDDATARKRFDAINHFEQLLRDHNSTTIFKFYLHISPQEQQERLKERLEDEKKQWKYNEKDIQESRRWDEYMKVYEDVFEHCSIIPWTIVPSDQNWYKEYLITKTVIDGLKTLNMKYPQLRGGGSV